MANYVGELGIALYDLSEEQADWSQATFGGDSVRGPVGALKHLEKEAREAQAKPNDFEEYADCFLLILDASRRAGLSPLQLIRHAQDKMKVNRKRIWPPITLNDEATEHVKTEEPRPLFATDDRGYTALAS